MKLLIFTEGTILMHKNAVGHSREEIIWQVAAEEKTVFDFSSYVPIGGAVEKLQNWKNNGVEIFYLTSRQIPDEVEQLRAVLKKFDFPAGQLLFRQDGEEYKDIAERIVPEVLIEDDCESIGGVDEMIVTHIDPEIKKKIRSVVVKEFAGIDHLLDKLQAEK